MIAGGSSGTAERLLPPHPRQKCIIPIASACQCGAAGSQRADSFLQENLYGVAWFFPNGSQDFCLHRELMPAIAESHERTPERMPVDFASDLNQASGSEKIYRFGPDNIRPSAFIGAFSEFGRERPFHARLTSSMPLRLAFGDLVRRDLVLEVVCVVGIEAPVRCFRLRVHQERHRFAARSRQRHIVREVECHPVHFPGPE